ncbi:patatin-like phospholipase family protein [Brevibacillus dissolubilis]|uniref:patatin-like phospholipase family protein n=1 Tax=Brevibacillus dissolubilis TaxID=1844116 RepID=UPI001115AF07|nr:patatin-like phospholipase family protein [Brevibacillus dissolubilis]
MMCGTTEAIPSPPKRLGLALSGGGFRASFFHIGTLARMAELRLLKHLEVISTVSGGSIIGALYYIHVKKRLEQKSDQELTDADYVEIVKEIEEQFLSAVQKNIYMHTFVNPLKNIKMCLPWYSRSDYIGELYDRYLYRPVLAPGSDEIIQMRNLKIQPKGEPPNFNPLKGNPNRTHKVPILLLNSTTLNTGHNWRFEASTMGLPPRWSQYEREMDKNNRYVRPASYDLLTEKLKNIGLGHAVAASACVPGIFPPMSISNMYVNGIRVQLVDGGVHDNQGIQGLLDPRHECTHIIVSDASIQMEDVNNPPTNLLAVLSRTSSSLMDRVREEEISRLTTIKKHVAFLHLRKGLPVKRIPYLDPEGIPSFETEERPIVIKDNEPPSENFHVHHEVQSVLSNIRTHLDSFTDQEAYSLMLDGYLMGREEIAPVAHDLAPQNPPFPAQPWRFRIMEDLVQQPTQEYLQKLRVSSRFFLKSYHVSGWAKLITLLVPVLLYLIIYELLSRFLHITFFITMTIGQLFLVVMGTLLVIGLFSALLHWLKQKIPPLHWITQGVLNVVNFFAAVPVSLLMAVLVQVDLLIYDPIFLRKGRVRRAEKPHHDVTTYASGKAPLSPFRRKARGK